eukprot:gnl/TRDRNA2_/TRDRNA2_81670_c0_seq2.p1 gnl/TRDRNA2_/TRDRNA2_81670_c0~~gnl/TRDRNA2_/TRDRNA2_81670_c0_seq2.p1  ORF type:complete len:585 (-),score=74.05 gnl/TRDRNA2_/TRDRNA2_81670_c0_seq2:93-1802(-)
MAPSGVLTAPRTPRAHALALTEVMNREPSLPRTSDFSSVGMDPLLRANIDTMIGSVDNLLHVGDLPEVPMTRSTNLDDPMPASPSPFQPGFSAPRIPGCFPASPPPASGGPAWPASSTGTGTCRMLEKILQGLENDELTVKDALGTLEDQLRSPPNFVTGALGTEDQLHAHSFVSGRNLASLSSTSGAHALKSPTASPPFMKQAWPSSPGALPPKLVAANHSDLDLSGTHVPFKGSHSCDRCTVLNLQVRALAQSLAGFTARTFNWSSDFSSQQRRDLTELALEYIRPCAHIDENLSNVCQDLERAKMLSSDSPVHAPSASKSKTQATFKAEPSSDTETKHRRVGVRIQGAEQIKEDISGRHQLGDKQASSNARSPPSGAKGFADSMSQYGKSVHNAKHLRDAGPGVKAQEARVNQEDPARPKFLFEDSDPALATLLAHATAEGEEEEDWYDEDGEEEWIDEREEEWADDTIASPTADLSKADVKRLPQTTAPIVQPQTSFHLDFEIEHHNLSGEYVKTRAVVNERTVYRRKDRGSPFFLVWQGTTWAVTDTPDASAAILAYVNLPPGS